MVRTPARAGGPPPRHRGRGPRGLRWLAASCLLVPAAVAGAADDLDAWLFPSLVPGAFSGMEEEVGPVAGDPAGTPGVPPRFDRLQLDADVRLWHDGERSLALTATYDELAWAGPAGGTALGIPRHERQLLVGTTCTAGLAEGLCGVHLDVGSASDRLGLDSATLVVDATAFARWPVHPGTGDRGDQWVALVEEDSNRAYLRGIPIPAVAYLAHPSPDCVVLLGLPIFECSWRPVPAVLLEVDAFTTADADLSVQLWPHWSASLSYAWYEQAFRERSGPRQGGQTVVGDMRASAGIAYDPNAVATVRLLGGYLFHRTITAGARDEGFGPDLQPRALPPTPVLALTCDIE